MNPMPAVHSPQNHLSHAGKDILIWDVPVRVFHWMLVLNFTVAWLTAEAEQWRLVHVISGYTVGGLVTFRLLWGLFGTRHARFASFVRGPKAVLSYLADFMRGRHQPFAGHNPAGGLAIMALLLFAVLTTLSGWAFQEELAGEWLEDVHETLANLMLALVLLHVAAVLVTSFMTGDHLVKAMWTGRKNSGSDSEGIRRTWRSLGILVLIAVMSFWWLRWDDIAKAPGETSLSPSSHEKERRHGDDDD